MKAALNRIAAMLGYVPAPAKLAPSVITMELNFEIDSAPLDAAITRLDQLSDAARRAEAAINEALLAQEGEFISAEQVSDETQDLILTELRKHTDLLSEIAASIAVQIAREDTQNKALMSRISITPATGAAASGLPG